MPIERLLIESLIPARCLRHTRIAEALHTTVPVQTDHASQQIAHQSERLMSGSLDLLVFVPPASFQPVQALYESIS
jgi:hypothetical protein